MAEHNIELTISKDGKVRVHVKGAKGKVCLEYAKWLQALIGETESQKMTSEFYEPEQTDSIKLKNELSE